MEIKKKSYKMNNIARTIAILSIFFAGGLAGIGLSYIVSDNPSFLSQEIFKNISEVGFFRSVYQKPNIYVQSLSFEPEHIVIDIKNNDFQKLAYARESALSVGILITSDDDYVPAKIRYENKTIDAKIRLKGDWIDHLQGEKWSFRIKVKGDNTLFGMNQFSIQEPDTKAYLNEWLFHKILKKEGILALRYDFIDVSLNGKNLGIYALEEHFDKRLIEDNSLREGPIIRFNEELYWNELAQRMILFNDKLFQDWKPTGVVYYSSSDIDAFGTKEISEDSISNEQFLKAKDLLESFRSGKLNTTNTFDGNKLAKYFAIIDLLGAEHASRWHNIRFYYNPITSRLEPIGFDGNAGLTTYLVSDFNDEFYDNIFNDMSFYRKYVEELEKLSEKSYLDDIFKEFDNEIQTNEKIIQKDNPEYHFSTDVFYKNQDYIRYMLNPIKGLHAYFLNNISNGSIIIEAGNIQALSLEILNVTSNNSIIFEPKERINILEGNDGSVNFQTFEFVIPSNLTFSKNNIYDLKLNYRVLGYSHSRNETIVGWSHLSEDFINNDFIRKNPNFYEFDFLSVNNFSKRISVKPGYWELNKSLIIPSGYVVTWFGDKPSKLDLKNKATILSYSPLQFFGSEDYPIIITSSDSTGQGITVLNSDNTSILENVIIYNLSAPKQNGWELSGAITFYESPVKIENSIFSNNKAGDDMLNIVRSNFEIRNSLLKNSLFDSLDVDFGKGTILDSFFIESGNDAMDFSGSIVEVNNVYINTTGDKGISSGEKSKIKAKQIRMERCFIAIASKDLSIIQIDDIKISASNIGFAAYKKKSEFGPAEIETLHTDISDIKTPHLIEVGSNLSIDGQNFYGNLKNVYGILYGEQ